MTVRELIELLKSFDQDLPVAYDIYSEQCLLEAGDLNVVELCLPRDDGWIHDKRPDMPSQAYLRFP